MRSTADRDTANYSLELVRVDPLIVRPQRFIPGARSGSCLGARAAAVDCVRSSEMSGCIYAPSRLSYCSVLTWRRPWAECKLYNIDMVL